MSFDVEKYMYGNDMRFDTHTHSEREREECLRLHIYSIQWNPYEHTEMPIRVNILYNQATTKITVINEFDTFFFFYYFLIHCTVPTSDYNPMRTSEQRHKKQKNLI